MIDIFFIVLQLVAMGSLTYCYVPQIRKLYEDKNADALPIAFWGWLSIGLVANVLISLRSGLIGGGWSMFIIQVINGSLAIWVLVLVFIYQKRSRS